jgi:hypothetical protein
MHRLCAAPLCLLFTGLASPSQATPFFARTYGLACASCHSGFPRLNEFGRAFKANNFRIPGAEQGAPLAWQKTIPLSAQVKPTTMRFNPGGGKSDFTDTQILAGGLLTRGTAFYIHHSYFFDAVPQRFPSWEAWVQQMVNEHGKIMLKAGQFELPYAYSPEINRTTVSSPLALFGASLQSNDVSMGLPMSGLQLSGLTPGNMRWFIAGGAPPYTSSANLVGERQFFGRFRDVFGRLAWGPSDREVGLFAMATHPPRSQTDPTSEGRGTRYGIDGLFHWRGFQVQAMAVYGENADPTGNGQKGVLRSGFVEVDRMLKPWLGLTGRWDVLTRSGNASPGYRDAKTVALRVYPYPLVKIQVEHQWLDHGSSGTYFMAAVAF